MRKNYPNLSIDQLDQSIVVETLIQRMFEKTLLFLIFYLCAITNGSAQCNTDVPLPFIESSYGNLSATSDVNGVCVLCSAFNASRLTDANLNNFATANIVLGAAGSVSYKVTDNDTDYSAGTYVGYRIDTGGLLSVSLLGSITIKTYLNGTLKETSSGSSLLGVGLLNGSGNNYVVGFNTTQSFDAIEISIGSLVGLLNSVDVYYPVIRNYCAGSSLSCNTPTAMSLPAYPVSLEPSHTGVSGVSVGSINDAANVISTSMSDYATIALTAGLASSASISVKDQLTDYPAGTYAGFEIENSNLLSVSALGNITITTYLNGIQKQQFSGNNLAVSGALLNNSGRYKVGFVGTTSFDEVQISINQTLALNLGSTKVYSAVFESFCAGPDLVCNTQTAMLSPTYPVYINGANTGIDGLVCALCSINNSDNLIDQNNSNFAQINLTASVGNSGSISVKDQITDYPIGSFAGFTIENPSLLNVNALDAITIRTYLNGVLQEMKFGNSALVAVGTNLLVGSSPQTIGFVTTKSFDEVRITIANTASVSLGVVNVYNAVFQKLCPVTLECNKTYTLTNPTFPVIIDSGKTGVEGVACVGCAVNNTNNVLTASTTDFATISISVGAVSTASIAVLDQLSTYPSGTYAGFTIENLTSLVQLDLFNSLRISTYLDGVVQESKSASLLLNLSLLTPYGSGKYNVGFLTTKSFDEIRITAGSLVGVSLLNAVNINVYGAFVNTASTSGGTLFCAVIDAVNDSLPSVIGATGSTNVGNVLSNDTLNGTPATINDVNVSVVTPATPATVGAPVPTIDPSTGIVSIPAGTPAGNYTIEYQICYKLNSLTCDSATVSITVTAAAIDAVDDNNSANTMVYGSTGGNTGINVYANDTLNGSPVNPSDVNLTSTPNGPLTVNTDGSVMVAPNTPGGTYTVDYTICEKLNPTNCNIATVSVFVSAPSIAVVKVGAVGGAGTLGDAIIYTFAVTNTGNTPLTNVVINDPLIGAVNLAITPSTLVPGAIGSATATYMIQQVDVDAGKVTNTATVTGNTADGGTVTDISGTTITNDTPTITTLTPNPSIALVKVGAVGGTGTLGDVITYTFTVTNTGNTTLSNILVDDVLTGSANLAVTPSTLAPNTTGTATATYTIQQPDVDLGKVTNTAKVTGTPPVGLDVTDISGTTIANNTPTETTLTPSPSIALVKEALVGGTGEVGYTIVYTFTVTNTGNTTLSNVVIDDALTASANLSVTPSILLPNATGTATATYTIQQSDMDAGKVINTAFVTGTTPAGGTITDTSGTAISNNDPTEVTLNPNSGIALVKTGAIGGTGAVGDVITYTFAVTNTGNTSLSNIIIDDALTASANLAVTPSTLAPNATGTATATYTIQQSDMDAGKVTNSATVTGTKPLGGIVTDTSGTTITNNDPTETVLSPISSIAVVKAGAIGGTGAVGDAITYTFTVTNTGNTTLSNIVIDDALTASVNLVLTPSSLAPNTMGTATATYTIQQSDIDVGKVTNTATVTGTKPLGGTVTDISGTTITNDTPTETILNPISSIALVKTGVIGGTGAVGDVITYTFAVTNTGNTTLSNIVVDDALTASINLVVIPSILIPGAIGLATATYAIQQSDMDAGKVTNTAVVTGIMPNGGTVTDTSGTTITNDDPTETTLNPNSSVALVKTGAVGGTGSVNDIITYTFTVTNTGSTTLSNIVVNDPLTTSINLAVAPSSLAPSVTGIATATYIIQQSDMDAGKVTNTATVKGTPPVGTDVTDTSGTTITNDDPTETTLNPNSSIALVKSGLVGGTGAVGDVITYTFSVTNTGNTTLSNIVVNDQLTASVNLAVTPSSLAPSVTGIATATYIIQQSDIDTGKVTNTATVTGTPPVGTDVTDTSGTTITNDDPTETTLNPSSSIALVKSGVVGGTGAVGDVITYTFSVTNTGNTTLSNIVVNDPLTASVNLAITPSSLAPSVTGTATATYIIQQSDIDAGKVTNTATVTGTKPLGGTVTDISGTTITNDDPTETALNPISSIALMKSGVIGGTGAVGDVITYTFTVTNTGNTILSNIVVNDPLTASVNLAVIPSSLAPNAIGTATATYTILQSDIDDGKVTNTATVTATTPTSGTVTDTSGATISDNIPTVTTLSPNPKIALVKVGVVVGTATVGNKITYTFTVTNIGNTTLNNIVVDDLPIGIVNLSVTPSTLAPNAIGIVTADYFIKQVDIDAGKVTNSATVTGTIPTGGTVSDISGTAINNDDPTETPLISNPSISITQDGVYVDSNGDGKANVGDTIAYTFTITNAGNLGLTNITIAPDNITTMNGVLSTLAVGTSNNASFTATYMLTNADIEAGYVYNLATATAISSINTAVTAISTDPTPCSSCPVKPGCTTCTITAVPQAPSIALMKEATFNDINKDGFAQVGETITYMFTIMNTGNLPLTNVVVTDPLPGIVLTGSPINLALGETNTTAFSGIYYLTQQDVINGSVSNQAKVTATNAANIPVMDMSDNNSAFENDATVLSINGCVVEVFNAVSPGSDGFHDFFRIRGIECYPKNTVEIYNRWGIKVYDAEGYNNDTVAFRGISEGRGTVSQSEGLPTGTYFYIIKYQDFNGNGIDQSGYLELNRD